MDTMNLLMVALTFVGAQVAQKAADGAIESVWVRFKEQFLARFGEQPSAQSSEDRVQEVLDHDPELAHHVASVFEGSNVLRRARLIAETLRGARVLWVDDVPQNNEWERLMLRELGVHVTAVTRTETALDCLKAEAFELVISDIARTGDPEAGIRSLPQIGALSPSVAVIFYVGRVSPSAGTPKGAAGITNRPDELLHLIMDVLERRRL